MSVLSKIFEPIADDIQAPLETITVIAFDTMGTLVRVNEGDDKVQKPYIADLTTVRLFRDVSQNMEKLAIDELVIITAGIDDATKALHCAGLRDLHNKPAENKIAFYTRMARENKKVLVVDDDSLASLEADAYVNPKSESVRAYLDQKLYRAELKYAA